MRLAAVVAVALVVAAATFASIGYRPATAAPAQSLFEEIGSVDRFGADARALLDADLVPTYEGATSQQKNIAGTALILPHVRQLWQVYRHQTDVRTGVVVRDLDTLEVVRTLRFDVRFSRAALTNSTMGGDWAHAVDAEGDRLFLAGCSCPGGHPLHIYEIDLRTFAMTARAALGSSDPFRANFFSAVQLGGMTYDPYEDELLVLYGAPANASVLNSNAFLYRLDVAVAPQATFDPARLYRLRSCTGPLESTDIGDDTYNWEVLVTETYLYVPCMRAGHTVVVVRMTRPDGNNPAHVEDVAAGPVYGETVLADQAGGRLFVVTFLGQEIWAFEAASMSFVGVVATGPTGTYDPTGYGLDPATGRIFFQSPTFGLGVVEGRFFPIPQARTKDRRVAGQERILSDQRTQRVFLLEGDGMNITKPRAYKIYRTPLAPIPPVAPDPDRNTADVPEQEGVTEPRYNASASGYGTRVLLAKGIAAVPPAPTVGVVAPTADALHNQTPLARKCGFTDRDLFAGRVAKAEYDTGSTAARAIAADVDGNTRQDLDKPGRCDLGFLGDQEDRWMSGAATCTSSDGNVPEEPAQGQPEDLGPSSAHCPPPGGRLTAQAEMKLNGHVQVDRSYTRTVLDRPPGGGVRSTVEAVANGVSLNVADIGVLYIGEVRSQASSFSNGRPVRKHMSVHEIEIHHVRLGDTPVCAASCDTEKLERDLNLLSAGRAVFRTGHGRNSGRDEALVEGSPRGAQTAVQKSVARQASDRALVGDFTVEVPTLEITVFNDNTSWGRARQVYQFAGVSSSATYNIVQRPAPVPMGGGGDLPEHPALGDGGSSPFAGLIGNDAIPFQASLPTTAPTAMPGSRDDGPSGIAAAVRAVARGLGVFFGDPRHALLLLTAWGLLGSPAVLSSRRRRLRRAVATS